MRTRMLGIRLAVVVAVALASVLLIAPATALAIGSAIHGTVSGTTAPLENIEVAAFVNDGGTWYVQDSTYTDGAGAYSLALAPGTYRVSFTDWNAQKWKREWYDNSATFASAQNIVLGDTTSYVADAVLSPWPRGTIKGTVTDPDAVGIEGVTVQTYTWDEVEARWTMGLGSATEFTGVDGYYEFPDTLAQDYLIEFRDDNGTFKSELYNNKYTLATANPVTVSGGGTLTANASLARIEYGSVAGVVTDALTAQPAPGIEVSGLTQNLFGDWEWGFSVETSSLGDYVADYVPKGNYHVLFSDYTGKYVQEFYPNAADEADATWVGVAPLHTTSGVNATLDNAAHIKGRIVAAESGAPLRAFANVYTWDQGALEWQELEAGFGTNANGYYDVGGLRAGKYAVAFQDPRQTYFTQFYNNVPQTLGDSGVPAGVTALTLTAGQVQSGIDGALVRGGVITGTVTNASGDPLSFFRGEAEVSVYDATTHEHLPWVMGLPDESGVYRCGPLPTGDYHVSFKGYDRYTSEYFSDKTSIDTASIVHVAVGSDLPGIDEVLAPTGTWGTVTGSVVDTNTGDALYGIDVGLIATDGSSTWVDETTTDGKGNFSFDYVQAGDYWLYFRDWTWQYTDVMYNGVDPNGEGGWTAADMVTVSGNANTAVSEKMTPRDENLGHITGFVKRNLTSTPIVGAPVNTYQYESEYDEWWWSGETRTGFDGTYHVPASPGEYRMEFGPTFDSVKEYFNDVYSFSEATTLTVAPSGSLEANAYLSVAKTVSGTVFFNGAPMPWARVDAWYWNAEGSYWDTVSQTYADMDGAYTVGGLRTGQSYRFGATSEDGNYSYVYYSDEPGLDMADDVVMDDNKTGIDFTLTEAGVVRGAVVDEDGNRVDEVKVKLWAKTASDAWAVVQSSTTYNGGDFQFGALPAPKQYWLQFEDPLGRYHGVWYDSAVTSATAEIVPTVAGESTVVVQQLVAATTEYLPIAGKGRIETAIAAANEAFPEGAQTVVIGTAYNWPDALGGAALAGSYQGPILLTAPDDLPDSVASAIEGLGATDAVILGSDKAVSGDVKLALDDLLGTGHVTRIGGANRYATANLIAQATVNRLGAAYDGTAFVATGLNFPDALGASPLAAKASWPIFLADPVRGLDASTSSMMTTLQVSKALILGSLKAVPNVVQTSLNAKLGSSNVKRLEGNDRYQTCVAVAQYGVDNVYGLGWNNVAIATGQNFPDALAGGVLQGQKGSVLLLTPGTSLNATVAAKLSAKKASITNVTYLGGTNVVTDAVRATIGNLLN